MALKAVTRDSLYYQLKKSKFGSNMSVTSHSLVGATVITNGDSQGVISDITREPMDSDTHSEGVVNLGGRKKGSTKSSKSVESEKEKEALFRCASLYKCAIDDAKKGGHASVPN